VLRSRMSGCCRLSRNDVLVGGFWSSGREENSHTGRQTSGVRGLPNHCNVMLLDVKNSPHRKHILPGRNVAMQKPRTGRPLLAVPYFLFSISQLASISTMSSSKSGTTFYRTSEANKEKHASIMGCGLVCFNTNGRFMIIVINFGLPC